MVEKLRNSAFEEITWFEPEAEKDEFEEFYVVDDSGFELS